MTKGMSTEIIDGIGYKKCQGNRIVKLEILGHNNQDRKVQNKSYAKYRCEKAKVLSIYHMDDRSSYDSAVSLYQKEITYKIGEIVCPDNYDKSSRVCSNGIHYFLTERAAYHYNYSPFNGIHLEYDGDGNLHERCFKKRGKIDGKYEIFGEDKKISLICNYRNGKLHGSYEKFNSQGILILKCEYYDSDLTGKYEIFYDCGQQRMKCHYS